MNLLFDELRKKKENDFFIKLVYDIVLGDFKAEDFVELSVMDIDPNIIDEMRN